MEPNKCDKNYECVVCYKLFASQSNVNKHIKVVHGVEELKNLNKGHQKITCEICEHSFFNKGTLNRHKASIHKIHLKNNDQKTSLRGCVECNLKFPCRKTFVSHIRIVHGFQDDVTELQFSSREDFQCWLKKTEEDNQVEYIRQTGGSKGKYCSRYYYECNRSGKKPNTHIRKRCLKSQGSKKIGFMCTSNIIVKVDNLTNAVNVKYFKNHYGHDIQLQHIRIPDNAKKNIAAKLLVGVSVPRIVDTIRDSIGDTLERVDLTTKKDIYNIKKSYKIDVVDGLRHTDDATSVGLWVAECRNDVNNPVLLYKPQGAENIEHQLSVSDFCLILMNSVQKKLMKKFCSKFICIDGTHGTNPYDFELTTLLVSDEFGEGMPVAYMVSNRKDTLIYELFFKVLKLAVGVIYTNTFMSDITETYYNAWITIMGTIPHRLYCSWHIDRAWKAKLMKIVSNNCETSVEKRKMVYKALKTIQTELDEEIFKKYYNEFVMQLESDQDTKSFHEYFINTYGYNQSLWAYCYRKELGINTNMYLESMHRIIKYDYLEGKKVKRLDKSLHSLMRFTRDKQVERMIKLTKGKSTDRTQAINSSHRTAINSNFTFKCVSSNNTENRKWMITNVDTNNTYTVEEKSNTPCCYLTCKSCCICYHSYSCTCLNYFIKSNICKHIHFICMQNSNNGVNRNCLYENNLTSDQPEISDCLQGLPKIPRETEKLKNVLISEALKLVTNASKPASDDAFVAAIAHLKAANAIFEVPNFSEAQQFVMPETLKLEPNNKSIVKQISFFTTKKKSTKFQLQDYQAPNSDEKSTIQSIFSKDLLHTSTDKDSDHNYM